jgi:hypothetical protein
MYLRDRRNAKVIELHKFSSHLSTVNFDLIVAPELRLYLFRTFVVVTPDCDEHVNRANVVKPSIQKGDA